MVQACKALHYDSTLYSYKTDNDGDIGFEAISTDAAIASIYDRHITDGIQVSNNSWGYGSTLSWTSENALRTSYSSTITAMRNAQTNGTLFVWGDRK